MQYTAMIVKSDDWYAATVKELPGVHTQGKTIDEIRENLTEAIEMILESRAKHLLEFSTDYFEEKILIN